MTRPLLLDLTGAPQDMAALVMALQVPDMLAPLLVTTGGREARQAHRAAALARMVLEKAGRADIPVHAGSGQPLFAVGGAWTPARIATGEEAELPAMAMIRHAMAQPAGSVSICCTGALTNLALALIQEPRLAAHLHGVVILADAGRGEESGVDANIHADPEAAATVLASGVPVTVLPRACVARVTADGIWMEQVEALAGRGCAGGMVHDLLRGAGAQAVPMAPAVAIIALLCPRLFAGHMARLGVECRGELTRGTLVRVESGENNIAPNTFILNRVNVDACREVARDLLLHAAGVA
ncbi:nucleoside hydrolase [Novacetimonas maltaceti]|uniref:Inosine-uridine preferring nucleoside hydrolase n=1 Tax=Novacetimonas maltaceti TaxID=1203393 RepID=A0A2S3W4G5_9PROT|nr:nucleoside hydrolase [Novacetimonas maltaceti]POF63750.1 Inosine-uridine preferring nucleoside hydrolase [Novacetimonas maltaceti]